MTEFNIGDGATMVYFTDRHACTVVAKTAKTITIQRDKATLKESYTPKWDSMCCRNQEEQEYDYERDPEAYTYKAYWSEKKQHYAYKGIPVIPGRYEFYDYNF